MAPVELNRRGLHAWPVGARLVSNMAPTVARSGDGAVLAVRFADGGVATCLDARTGEIHYNRVLKEVYDLGYRDYVGLELKPIGTERAAALAVAQADVW